MVSIARRNLFHDYLRLFISLGGVAFSVFLMLFVFGLYNGFEHVLVSYVYNQDGEIWIAKEGTKDFWRGGGLMPNTIADELMTFNDITDVNKLTILSIYDAKTKYDEKNLTIKLVGYNPQTGVGGPWKIVEGKDTVDKGEIIVDVVLARRNDVRINDLITIRDRDFTVVGISEFTNIFLWQYVFISYQDISELFGIEGLSSFFVVKVRDPRFTKSVIENIENSYEVNVFDKFEFMDNNKKLIREGFIAIFVAILILGIIVGTTFVALTIYTLTIERIKEYGILKALGATKNQLYAIIFEQSLTISLLSYLIGSICLIIVFSISRVTVPELATIMSPNAFIYVLGASIIISLLASYIPIRKVSKIDPLIIFR
jgi:putative ABC transport system permease protein